MLGYRSKLLILSIVSISCCCLFSIATPIVKGDEKPGEMPGLEFPLGTKYWLSPLCSTGSLEYEKTKTKYLTKKKNRPRGWKKKVLEHGEFILNHTLGMLNHISSSVQYCPFLTIACCRSNQLYQKNPDNNKRNIDPYVSFEVPYEECSSTAEIGSKSWGTCAFVTQGTSLRRVARGHEIDRSDTVIRLGHMPLKGWEKYTGRRTDVVIGRGSIQTKYAGDYSEVKVLIGTDKAHSVYTKEKSKFLTRLRIINAVTQRPQKVSLSNGNTVLIGSAELSSLLYDIMTAPINHKKRGPTTGFSQILNIFLSGFCETLHIYGTTPNCGGYYHSMSNVMKIHHSCELESWALHYLMRSSQAQLCVWI